MSYYAPTAAEAARLVDFGDQPNAEVLVATTWKCNLRCSYCFVKGRTHLQRQPQMSAEAARRLVDVLDSEMKHVETICIHVYGGEPLTNLTALHALVEAALAKQAGRFNFAITTNGTLLTDEIIGLLNQGKFQVILSIDGPDQVHDACRVTSEGAPTHARVMKFLLALKKRTKCWVRGSAVVQKNWSLKEAGAYLRTLPVDAIKAQAVRIAGSDSHALSEVEKRHYLDDLEDIGRKIIEELENGIRPKDDRFSNRVLQLLKGSSRSFFCGAGETTFGFMPDGKVTPCVLIQDERQTLGHIDDAPDTWIEWGRRWRTQFKKRKECEQCAALSLCGGGCAAIMPICGADECEITRKNCEIAHKIYRHFADCPEKLLLLAGIA
jgi:uncharacterized protein